MIGWPSLPGGPGAWVQVRESAAGQKTIVLSIPLHGIVRYLLDTYVVSETSKSSPSTSVVEWLEEVSAESLFISTLTLGEIRYGIDKLTDVSIQTRLNEWLERDVVTWFGTRLLPIDAMVADTWGRLRNRYLINLENQTIASTERLKTWTDSLQFGTASHGC